MRILVACEFSGTVRDAFREKGHEAWSCDIIPTDAEPAFHYQCDALELLDMGWDMLIAHPPCTFLSNAGAVHLHGGGTLNQERYMQGIEAKQFFMKMLNSGIQKVCIENPVPSKIFELPEYTQIIHPYYFGERYKKRTCLWLKGLPELVPTKIHKYPISTNASIWFNNGMGEERQKRRAKTFKGIAQAMADQWG